jgi:hypothetical protein
LTATRVRTRHQTRRRPGTRPSAHMCR